ncbi:hypothetical protein BGZ54_003074, partial [Gamsiella multidivaricata]
MGPQDNEYSQHFGQTRQQLFNLQKFQSMPMLSSDQLNCTSISYESSPMDLSIDSPSLASPGTSSKSVAAGGQISEEGQQSRTSSQDFDDTKPVVNGIIPKHYLSSTGGHEFPSTQFHMSGILSTQNESTQVESQSKLRQLYGNGSNHIGGASSDTGDTVDAGEDPAIKRAQQNRAAQRAFRQRKQQYIKWLESKAEELDEVYRIVALLRAENEQLRGLAMDLDASLVNRKGGAINSEIKAARSLLSPSSSSAVEVSSSHRIDLSLSREVTMRLMNLAALSG